MMDPSIFREAARAAVSAQGGDFDLADFKYLGTNNEIGETLTSYPAIKSVLTDQDYWGSKLNIAKRMMLINNKNGMVIFQMLHLHIEKDRLHTVVHTLMCRANEQGNCANWYSQSCCIILDSATTIDPLIQYYSFKTKNNNIYSSEAIYNATIEKAVPIPYSRYNGLIKEGNKLTHTDEYLRVRSMLKEMGITPISDNNIIIDNDDLRNMKEKLQLIGYFERYDEAKRTLEVTIDTYKFHLYYQKIGVRDNHNDSFEHIFAFERPTFASQRELVSQELTITLDAKSPSKSFVYHKLFDRTTGSIPDVSSASDIALPHAMYDRLNQSRKSLTDSTRKLSSNRIKRGNRLT